MRKRIRVNFREIMIRLKAFRGFVIAFFIVTSISSFFLRMEYGLPPIESYYEAITLLFYASDLEYPRGNVGMELFFVAYPLLGLFLIIDGLSGIGSSIKFGDPTSEIYNQEMASLFSDHICVVGLGHLGTRVVDRLKDTNEDVIIIEKSVDRSKGGIIENYQINYRIPVIIGDALHDLTMKEANVAKAKTMLVLVDDDLVNLKIAVRARRANPDIELIIRIFDEDLAQNIQKRLHATILSTNRIATPSFIGRIPRKTEKSTGHIVIIGMGKLGISVVEVLHHREKLVAIDEFNTAEKVEFKHMWEMSENISVVQGDARLERVLVKADIEHARAVLILVGEDIVALKIATQARDINPDIELILRMYDDPLAEDTKELLDAKIMSTTKIAVKEFLSSISR